MKDKPFFVMKDKPFFWLGVALISALYCKARWDQMSAEFWPE